jgi:hypothetical protein
MKRWIIPLAAMLMAGCATIAGPPPLAAGPFQATFIHSIRATPA